jgi:outer membrane protein assembly factor BamA
MSVLKSEWLVHSLYAPFYSHNRYVEEIFGIYCYGYPSDTTQYSVTADYSTKVQRDIDLTYKNVAAGEGGRYILAGRVNWFKNPFRRLFGIGNQTLESDETSYTSRETLVELTAEINVNEDVMLMWTEHYHGTHIDAGIVNPLPQAQVQFNQLPAMEGATIVGHKLTARYDTRDKQLLTKQGTYVNLSVELNENFQHGGASPWVRTTLDARHLLPHYDDQLVFVARFLVDTVNGHTQNIPFYERPTLGGKQLFADLVKVGSSMTPHYCSILRNVSRSNR